MEVNQVVVKLKVSETYLEEKWKQKNYMRRKLYNPTFIFNFSVLSTFFILYLQIQVNHKAATHQCHEFQTEGQTEEEAIELSSSLVMVPKNQQ